MDIGLHVDKAGGAVTDQAVDAGTVEHMALLVGGEERRHRYADQAGMQRRQIPQLNVLSISGEAQGKLVALLDLGTLKVFFKKVPIRLMGRCVCPWLDCKTLNHVFFVVLYSGLKVAGVPYFS